MRILKTYRNQHHNRIRINHPALRMCMQLLGMYKPVDGSLVLIQHPTHTDREMAFWHDQGNQKGTLHTTSYPEATLNFDCITRIRKERYEVTKRKRT